MSKIVVLLHFTTMNIYREAHSLVTRIMHRLESMVSIVKKCNIILFTDQQLLSVLYSNTPMKLAGRVSSVGVLVLYFINNEFTYFKNKITVREL